jgi:hypothetical protein
VAPASAAVAPCGGLTLRSHWAMDEAPGASTMHDDVGGRDGTVHYAQTGATTPPHTGFGSFYRFGLGAAFPRGSQVAVADSDLLDPGSCDFAVELWVSFDNVGPHAHRTYNVAQKGLSTSPGNWKLEVDGRSSGFGRVICTFDGANDGRGPLQVESSSASRVEDNGDWTRLRCERRGNDFVVRVGDDPEAKRTVSGIGPITNSNPLTVGAKALQDADTFPGAVDDISYWAAR